jgi:transposase-like protein
VKATEKIEAFGVKALADAIGVDLVTVYRWRRALDSGAGISDANKRRLVAATAAAEHPIAYADFFPVAGKLELALDVAAGAGAIIALAQSAWSQVEEAERAPRIRQLVEPLYEAARRLQRGREASPCD